MTIKRLTTKKQREILKNNKIFKGKNINQLSQKEKDALLELLAKKANLL